MTKLLETLITLDTCQEFTDTVIKPMGYKSSTYLLEVQDSIESAFDDEEEREKYISSFFSWFYELCDEYVARKQAEKN